ncbi:MAG: hypothetical protein QM535_15190, partial [Limnohabitans sp.]|nr:hypothetical protein [Limnohabitans sp.]
MNTYNPHIHHRKSIRLKGFDYSQAGLYFVTICCQNRIYRFGDVNNGNMILNEAGVMVKNWYYEIENKFPDIVCHDMIIMPNHFHCIVENVGTVGAVGAVGADLRVCPNNPVDNDDVNNVIGVIIKGEHNQNIKGEHNQNIKGEHNQNIK